MKRICACGDFGHHGDSWCARCSNCVDCCTCGDNFLPASWLLERDRVFRPSKRTLKKPKMMTRDERQALRGVVRHILRPARLRHPLPRCGHMRNVLKLLDADFRGIPRGFCRWCGRPASTDEYFVMHPTCGRFFNIAVGKGMFVAGTACAKCGVVGGSGLGRGTSINTDHVIGLAIARELGAEVLARAYLPSNLQPLCRNCHVVKTQEDNRRLAELRGEDDRAGISNGARRRADREQRRADLERMLERFGTDVTLTYDLASVWPGRTEVLS